MECNRDEAARAKEIAEKKFIEKDLVGARKFALKAQNLYPELEGISQMVATLDVYISSENKVNGEEDWYGILGINPLADDDMVRKQYRKLALVLHPDKNKSVGADGAFKLISMAWSLLSDKTKRTTYDQNRMTNIFRKVSNSAKAPSTMPSSSGFNTSTKATAKANKSVPKAGYSSPVSSKKSKQSRTFWTVCHQCRMQYEYLRVYLNHNLLCPNCHEPFIATETAPPSSTSFKSTAEWNFSQQSHQQASDKNTTKASNASSSFSNGGINYQWTPFSSKTGTTSNAAQAASVVQQAYEKVRREREAAQAATRKEESLKRKHVGKRMGGGHAGKRRRNTEDGSFNNDKGSVTNQMVSTSRRSGSTGVVGITRCSNLRDATEVEIEPLLVDKARNAISKKLYDLNSATMSELFMETGNDSRKNDTGSENSVVNGDANEPCAPCDPPNPEVGFEIATSDSKINREMLDSMFIDVPDADFYNFDNNRTETCFGKNQVWAAYDYNEGFPRYYAMIHAVISLDPLKLRISWLKSRTTSEFGPMNWVRWTRGIHGSIHIYPRKGDVWALYRNWSPGWNELTENEVIQKYDVVEVLEDFDKDLGIVVVPLGAKGSAVAKRAVGRGRGRGAATADDDPSRSSSSSSSSSTSSAKKHSARPAYSKFSQQELSACKPILTPGLVIATFTFVGFIFIPIGLASLSASENVIEIVDRYDADCIPNSFSANAVNYIQNTRTNKTCSRTLMIPKPMKQPIYVYYQLDNFYQNHRRYVRSRSNIQLLSKAHEDAVSPCKPEDSVDGKPIVPCGLIAWSLFNDTYSFTISTKKKVLSVNKKDIAWASDREHKFGSDVYPKNFQNSGLIGGAKLNSSIPLSEQENLLVWMRTAALPTFRKLYGRIEEDLEANDQIEVAIENNYNSYGYGGKKMLILSTSTWIGGRNDFLGAAYLAVGGICFLLAISFILIYLLKSRPLGDPSYLSWNKT
ncbi:unnamed protein product [Linum trigynum]|uniref:J domain-containing protein n=1 Tax=Linum trigynum TaxID=586398 RepID=A0AAV2DJR1_9ROSI